LTLIWQEKIRDLENQLAAEKIEETTESDST
jgi:hypothetical protein